MHICSSFSRISSCWSAVRSPWFIQSECDNDAIVGQSGVFDVEQSKRRRSLPINKTKRSRSAHAKKRVFWVPFGAIIGTAFVTKVCKVVERIIEVE